MLWASVICLFFFSNSFITDEFVRAYEDRSLTYSQLDNNYDVAIVLGGFSNEDQKQELVQFHSATDRLMAGLKLYKQGKADKLLISSGSGHLMDPDAREALFIKKYLIDIGFPENDLIIESESKNTHENAVYSAKMLNHLYPKGKFVLITSATHMPRAKRCFTTAGLTVTPYSVDHQAGPRKYYFDHLLIPSAENLRRWQMLTKEWLGFIAYKMMGFI